MSLKDLSALIFAVASAIFLSTVSGAAGSYNSQAVGQQVPSVVSPPSVSGTAEVGESLSADPGDWSGPAATFAYGWQRCDSSGDGCTDVADASSPTYALAAVDVGSTMRVVVTALNKNGSALAVSAPAAVVAPAPAPPPVVSSWAITPSALPAASVGTAYSQQLAETGPNPPYSFRVGQGSLPPGISLSSDGLVAGTPMSSGSSSFTVTAQDSTGVTAGSQNYSLSVADSSSGAALTWAPPVLTNPITVQLQDSGQLCPGQPNQNPNQPWVCYLDTTRDYILVLHHRLAAPGGVDLDGGHNVVVVGGQIDGYQRTCCDGTDEWKSRGMTIEDQTGTVHVEGVLIQDASDGISIRARQATVQIENVRVANLHVYQDNFGLAHPDIIQTFDGPKEVRVDHLTGDSDWTGLSWFRGSSTASFPGKVTLKNVNLSGNLQPNTVSKWPDGTTRTKQDLAVFSYMNYTTSVHSCTNCWVTTGWYDQNYQRKLQETVGIVDATDGSAILPWRVTGYDGQVITTLSSNNLGRRQGDYIEWPTVPTLANVRWYWGTPTTGDFVPTGLAGTTYASPGYGG